MNRRILVPGLLVVVVSTLSFLLFQIVKKIDKNKIVEENASHLVNLSWTKMDGNTIDGNQFINNKSTVLVLFNSECSICTHEAREIKENINKFNGVNILLTSTEPLSRIKDFAAQSGLAGNNMITFAQINSDIWEQFFGNVRIPSVLIYSDEGKLRKKFVGETKTEAILDYIQ